MATTILESFGVSKECTSTDVYRVFVVGLPAVFIIYPLTQPKAIASQRYPSLVGICGIITTYIIVCIQTPFFYFSRGFADGIVMFKLDFGIFQCFGITYFAYICQQAFSSIFSELINPTRERITKVRITI